MKRFFLEDIQTKILALIFALLLWSFIRVQFVDPEVSANSARGERIYTQIPISIMQQPYDKNVYELDPSTATVTLSGNRNVLKNTGNEMVVLYVTVDSEDMEKKMSSQSTNAITIIKKIQYNIPSDVTMRAVDPKVVRISTVAAESLTDKPEDSQNTEKAAEESENESIAQEKEPQ